MMPKDSLLQLIYSSVVFDIVVEKVALLYNLDSSR